LILWAIHVWLDFADKRWGRLDFEVACGSDRENDGFGGFQVRFKFLTAIGALAGGWIRTNRKVSGGPNC
jgi:hypothetical protein